MERDVKQILSGVGFYGTLAVCLAVVGVCSWLLLAGGDEPAAETPVTPQVPVSQPVKMPEKAVEAPVEAVKEVPVPEPAPEAPAPQAADTAPVAAQAPRVVVNPVEGEVQAAFSMDELVYNPALGDWRTHDGVDFSAPAGTAVLAACAGTVAAVTEDPLLGTAVVLDHGDGCRTTYANLQAAPAVSAGDTVAAGETIGAVGSTAPGEDAAPHLHFSVSREGKAVDPREFLEG